MELLYKKITFNRIINISDVINASCLFVMGINDIGNDIYVCGEKINEDEEILVFQNNEEPFAGERYCYIKTKTMSGLDGHTKMIVIEKVITDKIFVTYEFFLRIITILLQQENDGYNNRIVIGCKINDCFNGRIEEVSNNCSLYLCDLFTSFLDNYDTPYTIKTGIQFARQ